MTEWRFSDDASDEALRPPTSTTPSGSLRRSARNGAATTRWVWFRTTITIPEKLGAFRCRRAVSGSSSRSTTADRCSSTARRSGNRFEWNGEVVLSESAKPGDKFQVAIHALNIGGPGRLMAANLVFDAPRRPDREDLGLPDEPRARARDREAPRQGRREVELRDRGERRRHRPGARSRRATSSRS